MPANSTQQTKVIEDNTDREAAYDAALKLVARIDKDLSRGVRQYWDRTDRLLTTLAEVVRAILAGSLPEED